MPLSGAVWECSGSRVRTSESRSPSVCRMTMRSTLPTRDAERHAGDVELVPVKIGDRHCNIDVNWEGRLFGLELFDASTFLPDDTF